MRADEVATLGAALDELADRYAPRVRELARRDLIRDVEALEADLRTRERRDIEARRQMSGNPNPGALIQRILIAPKGGDRVEFSIGYDPSQGGPSDRSLGMTKTASSPAIFSAAETVKQAIRSGKYDDRLTISPGLAIYLAI